MEFSILILAEQGGAHAWESFCLQHAKSFLEGVVKLDLAVAAEDEDTTGTVIELANNVPRVRESERTRTSPLAASSSRR